MTLITLKDLEAHLWQAAHIVTGPREIQKALLVTLAQFGLGKDKELFDKAYGYIEEHY